MAIITKAGSPVKGAATVFTLNKADLLAHASVSSDAYFSNALNWNKVALNYESTLGGQKEFLVYSDFSGATDAAIFSIVPKGRDAWELASLIIVDKQGGSLVIDRSLLTVGDCDVDFRL